MPKLMTKNIAQRIEEKLIFLRCEREILEKELERCSFTRFPQASLEYDIVRAQIKMLLEIQGAGGHS